MERTCVEHTPGSDSEESIEFTDPEDRKKGDERLRLYRDKKPYRQTG